MRHRSTPSSMHEVRLTPVEASYVKGLQSHLMSKCSRRDTPSFHHNATFAIGEADARKRTGRKRPKADIVRAALL
jgi:hypothetical protein